MLTKQNRYRIRGGGIINTKKGLTGEVVGPELESQAQFTTTRLICHYTLVYKYKPLSQIFNIL